MTKTTIVSAAVTLVGGSTTITNPSAELLSGSSLINYGSTAVLVAADIFIPSNVSFNLTNQTTLSLDGTAVGIGTEPNFATGVGGYSPFGLAAAVDSYGAGTFTNAGLVESSLIETIVAATATTTPLFESTSDGIFLAGGTLINLSSGIIEANGVGAYVGAAAGGDGIINNAGLIQGLQSTIKGSYLFGTSINSYTKTAFGYGVQIGQSYDSVSVNAVNSLINSGTIKGSVAVDAFGLVSISNSGTILSDGPGVQVGASLSATSANGGAIYGPNMLLPSGSSGAYQYQPSNLMVTNTGLISSNATAGFGINFEAGTVINEIGGTILGYNGAVLDGFQQPSRSTYGVKGGVVVNDGMITGGVSGASGSLIENQAGGQISGGHDGVGVYLNGATFENAGTVAGTKDAVSFGSAGGTIIVESGAVFTGSIATNSSIDVVAFAAPTSGSSISLSTYFGGNLSFDFSSASSLTVEGNVAQLASGAPISGLTQGDTIKLDGIGATTATFVAGVGLELSNATSTVTLDIQGNFTTSDFVVSDPPAVTTIAVNANPCFAASVEILTDKGPVPVESLKVGDHVVRVQGGVAPIVWIGRRRLNLARHPYPDTVNPILIEASAIADQVPNRDLYVSPDHAIALAGCLIPAKALTNGFTIRQVKRPKITYYHVELADHSAIYADGCPVESYLETGNRGAFDNSDAPLILYPDLAQTKREKKSCAPFVESGPIAEAVRASILARAKIAMTSDPGLMIMPRPDGAVVIASRTAKPGETTADPRDRRTLGVKIVSLQAGGRAIPLDHPALSAGWHDIEADGRWTDGNAIVPANLVTGDPVIVQIGAALNYPLNMSPMSAHAKTRHRGIRI